MTPDNSTELSVEHLLQSAGLQIVRIPEADTKTPDFHISDVRGNAAKQLSAYNKNPANFRSARLCVRTFDTALKIIPTTKNHT
jgi:hypothetical protein